MLVVDASVAMKWVLDEAGDVEARALIERDEPLIAPDLITAEVTNAAWRRFLKGDIPLRQAVLISLEVPRVFAELFTLAPLASRALEIAAELRHPAHDCFYLALAESEDALLVTADRRLIARLAGSSWGARCRPLRAFSRQVDPSRSG
jgi:predicted nucleic acid-binding protein